MPAVPALTTLLWDCFDIAVCYELLYIKGNMCLYKGGGVACVNIYTRMYRVIFYCTILVDAAVRLLIVRVLYVVIYRRSRLYVSVFIVSFILYI